MFLLPNALFDSPYWTGFNMVLNPVIFGAYHIFVLGSSLTALSYVILPRVLFDLAYVYFAIPSLIMLAHFSWNFIISGAVASSVTTFIIGTAFSVPQLNLISCVIPIGLILWRVLR